MISNRVILEVLKYCSAKDLLQNLSLVNKQFLGLSRAAEVWLSLLPEYVENVLPDLTPQVRMYFYLG